MRAIFPASYLPKDVRFVGIGVKKTQTSRACRRPAGSACLCLTVATLHDISILLRVFHAGASAYAAKGFRLQSVNSCPRPHVPSSGLLLPSQLGVGHRDTSTKSEQRRVRCHPRGLGTSWSSCVRLRSWFFQDHRYTVENRTSFTG